MMSRIKAVGGAIKSNYKKNSVDNKLASNYVGRIGGPTAMGEKNYNTAHKAVKGFLKKNDVAGAEGYTRSQMQKAESQRKDKTYSRLK